jgi:hypothetical protein
MLVDPIPANVQVRLNSTGITHLMRSGQQEINNVNRKRENGKGIE